MPASKQPIPSVWARPRTKREQPALSRERIVAEAIQLLDAEGIEALSMRSLGTRLDAGATSLYRHVANKDELIELVVDEVYGEMRVSAADGPGGWREAIAAAAHSHRSMILRHPWLVSVLGQVGLVSLGPNLIQQSERLLALFQAAGFDAAEADKALNTLLAYVIGMTTSEAAYLSMLARTGQTEQELMESLKEVAAHAVHDYPLLRDGYDAREGQDPQQAREENFTYGIDCVLDGLEVRLGRIG